jgi:hypothetical protein
MFEMLAGTYCEVSQQVRGYYALQERGWQKTVEHANTGQCEITGSRL